MKGTTRREKKREEIKTPNPHIHTGLHDVVSIIGKASLNWAMAGSWQGSYPGTFHLSNYASYFPNTHCSAEDCSCVNVHACIQD